MNSHVRRQLLFEKVVANNQRRGREELLRRLPPHLSGVLGVCPCIYSAELDLILRRFSPFNRTGLGSTTFTPLDYSYFEMAWEDKALALLPRLVVPHVTGKAFLLLQSPTAVGFGRQQFYQPGVPLFVVDFRWAAPFLKELRDYCKDGFLLVEEDLRAGVLMDSFSGILPEDPNPAETVFDVGLWPIAA